MLCGLPGSGKSAFAKSLNKKGVICSSDEKRKELFGDIMCQEHNNEVFSSLHKDIKYLLSKGHDVIYDACNISSKRRREFLNTLSSIPCYKKAVILVPPYEICLRRNWMRERKIPDEAIKRMYMSWQTPMKFEGFDEIVCLPDARSFNEYDYVIVNNYDQRNPNHSKDLVTHMKMSHEYLLNKGISDPDLLIAAIYHDNGKPFCREIDEKGIAHYYNHHNVGAYDALVRGLTIETSALINYHMYPMMWKSNNNWDKLCEKYRKIWGDEFFGKIMLLYEADKASS
jgi:predicted kinase